MQKITKEMYRTKDGTVFVTKEEAQKHEFDWEIIKNKKKGEDLGKKVEALFPKFKKISWDTESQEIVDKIPDHLKYEIDLRCDFSGIPLRIYKTKFHDSGHQYEKSYSERLERILSRDFQTIKIGDIVRTYSTCEYERAIVPIIKANKAILRKYLLYYFTGVI